MSVAEPDFEIYYQPNCRSCGEPTDDPFMDDLCFDCDHGRHWDASDCSLCWPDDDVDDYYFYDFEDDDEPARPIEDVKVGGEVV
jgi:hypothetical protein